MVQIDRTSGWIRPVAMAMVSCAAVFVAACAPDGGKAPSGPQAVERGAQVFEYNCGYCHGPNGRGPKLEELKSLSGTDRRGRMLNHPISGQLPQRLAAHEISDLIEFLESSSQ